MSFSNQSTVPIHMLPGLGERTAKALKKLGIRTIGEFKQTPERVLVELFGPSIKSLHRYVSQDSYRVIQQKRRQQAQRSPKAYAVQPQLERGALRKQYAKAAMLSALAFAIS